MKQIINKYLNDEKILLTFFVLTTLVIRIAYTLIFYFKSSNVSSLYLFWGEQFSSGNWSEPIELASQMNIAPFISIIVFLFIKIFSDPVLPFYLYQCLISGISVIALYYLGRTIFNKRVAISISIWFALFPESIKYCPMILKESTLYVLIPLMLLLYIKGLKSQKMKIWLASSVIFALLIHTDEKFLIYLPFFSLFLLLQRTFSLREKTFYLFVWLGLILLLMAPWTIRNYKVYNDIVIVSPRTTVFTSLVYGKDITSITFSESEEIQKQAERHKEKLETFENKYNVKSQAFSRSKAKFNAFVNFWQPTYFRPAFLGYGLRPQIWSFSHNLSSILFYGIFLPFYILGFFLLIIRKHWTGFFIALIPLLHSIVHSFLTSGLERYRSPITFIVVMVGIWAGIEFFRILSKKINALK